MAPDAVRDDVLALHIAVFLFFRFVRPVGLDVSELPDT